MAQRSEVEQGRVIIERWCVLAEQRLAYLAELLESGRWRRFFDESDFLENLEEAKVALEAWRLLAFREATPDNRPVNLSWLGRDAVPLAQRDIVMAARAADPASAIAPDPLRSSVSEHAAAPPVSQPGAEHGLDLAVMRARYPLLRNAL